MTKHHEFQPTASAIVRENSWGLVIPEEKGIQWGETNKCLWHGESPAPLLKRDGAEETLMQ
jgi:hypothetical protein